MFLFNVLYFCNFIIKNKKMDINNLSKTNKIVLGVVSAISIFLIIKFFKKKSMEDNKQELDLSPVWDSKTEAIIKTLHPAIRDRARGFINEAEKQGFKLKMVSGNRTYEEQNKLYAKGRTTSGAIVTRAKAGYSWHNFALAFDSVPVENGKINWNSKNFNKIGEIGKKFGFEWGGDWTKFVDKPHLQDTFGMTTAQAREKKAKNKVDKDGYLLL